MNVSVFVAFMALIALASAQYGVWSSENAGCPMAAQVSVNNFVTYINGPASCGPGVQFGLFSQTPKDLFVELYGFFGQDKGITMSEQLQESYVVTAKTFDISIPALNKQIAFVAATTSLPAEGVYQANVGTTLVTIELLKGMFTRYTVDETNSFAHATFGLFTFSGGNIVVSVITSIGNSGAAIGSTLTIPFASGANGAISLNGVTYTPAPTTAFEGIWVASQDACTLTGQFTKTMFRIYQKCVNKPRDTGIFFGVYTLDATNFNFRRVGDSAADANMKPHYELSTIPYTLNSAKDLLTLTLNSKDPTPTMLKLYKVVNAPAGVQVKLTLNAPFSAYVEADFIANLAKALGILPSQIRVLSAKAGSIIVDFVLVSAPGGVTAAAAFNTLASTTSIGGYPVTSVSATSAVPSDDADNTVQSASSGSTNAVVKNAGFMAPIVLLAGAFLVCDIGIIASIAARRLL